MAHGSGRGREGSKEEEEAMVREDEGLRQEEEAKAGGACHKEKAASAERKRRKAGARAGGKAIGGTAGYARKRSRNHCSARVLLHPGTQIHTSEQKAPCTASRLTQPCTSVHSIESPGKEGTRSAWQGQDSDRK